MRPLALAAALAGLLAAGAPGPASAQKKDEEYEVKIASPKTGEKVKVTVSEDVETKITVYVVGKNEVKTEYRTKRLVYEDKILFGQPGSRLPASAERKYELATVGTGIEKDKIGTEGLPIQGKLVEISNNGGPTYTFKLDKKNLNSGESFDLLKAEFSGANDLRDHMLPKNKLKEKDGWELGEGKPGPKAVALELSKSPGELQLNELSATISGKLLDVVKPKGKDDKDKPLMGKLEVTFKAPVQQFAKDKGFMTDGGGTYEVKLTGDGCIDGRSPAGHLKTEMKLKVTGTLDGFKMDVEITATEDRKTEFIPPEPKKKP